MATPTKRKSSTSTSSRSAARRSGKTPGTWRDNLKCTRPHTWKDGKTPTQGHRVIRWIEQNCVHTKARWIGKPFRLLAWQKLLILALFALDPSTGLRVYRWALIGVAKKNGKTELAAALGLYFLLGDGEPGSLVVCAAASDDQADLVFGAAKTMCTMSPTLSKVTKVWEKEIEVTDPALPGCSLVRVAAAAGTNDGKNIHAVIIDELHEWVGPKGENIWNVLTNGTGARTQPMVLQITTAGFDIEGTICGQQYMHCDGLTAKPEKDPTYFFFWVEAPRLAKHTDPRVWEAANPSYGVTVHESFFRDQVTKKTEATFRRFFLCQWTESEEVWEVAQLWPELPKMTGFDPKKPIFVGIDVALKHDSCAVAVAQWRAKKLVAHAKIWENPYRPQHELYRSYRFNIAAVEKYLLDLYERFPEWARPEDGPGPAFVYDPNFFARSAQLLEADGLNMVEWPQSNERMVPASQTFYELVKTGVIAHGHDPDVYRQIRAVTADQQTRGWRISKPKNSRKKIDAAVALAIACYAATLGVIDESYEPVVLVG